jgi:hypothetical protein
VEYNLQVWGCNGSEQVWRPSCLCVRWWCVVCVPHSVRSTSLPGSGAVRRLCRASELGGDGFLPFSLGSQWVGTSTAALKLVDTMVVWSGVWCVCDVNVPVELWRWRCQESLQWPYFGSRRDCQSSMWCMCLCDILTAAPLCHEVEEPF